MSEVRASHLLVKHQGSRRPASWRDESGQYITKKTKEAAMDELMAGAVSFTQHTFSLNLRLDRGEIRASYGQLLVVRGAFETVAS